MSSLASFVVIEAAITALETPQARPEFSQYIFHKC